MLVDADDLTANDGTTQGADGCNRGMSGATMGASSRPYQPCIDRRESPIVACPATARTTATLRATGGRFIRT
jgi:hypothetical protein